MSELIGLDIGSHSIKLAGLRMTSKGPFLTHLSIKEIPYGPEREDSESCPDDHRGEKIVKTKCNSIHIFFGV